MGTASEPSTWGSKLPVTKLVFLARGAFARSTPCLCALRGFLPGRVFPDRTTRRHGLARLPPNWVGLAGRVVTWWRCIQDFQSVQLETKAQVKNDTIRMGTSVRNFFTRS